MFDVGKFQTRGALVVGPFLFGFCLVTAPWAAVAQESSGTPTIVRVEEDWLLEVRVPDPDTNAPQISCVFAPTADVDFGYAEFDINHHSQPAYRAGGLQLQVWSGGQPLVINNDPDGGILSQSSERITWTQSMWLGDDGLLTFAVKDGHSQTWGVFGNDARLQLSVAAQLTDLNGYDPDVSIRNSGIGYASNRVKVLKITAVRRYAADGQSYVDSDDRVVFERE